MPANKLFEMHTMQDPPEKGKKILFANFPADGHFNPLTGLAVYLRNIGYEVRWYTSRYYSKKLEQLQIPHYPFKKALEVTENNFDRLFPERRKLNGHVEKLCFDLIHSFILRAPEYFEDISEIYSGFRFDAVICDCTFTAIPFIKEKISVPVFSIGIIPLTESSKDLPPAGLGLLPSNSIVGKKWHSLLRFISDKILFRKPMKTMNAVLSKSGIKPEGSNIFDILIHKSTLFLQTGTPGFEYKRSDLGKNIRFIGALLPYTPAKNYEKWYSQKLNNYKKILLVTQGTVEKDVSKLLQPTLEAYKNTDFLVIATTGGSGTGELREKFPQENIIVEDFIPFADVMPYVDIYITNGGYGGVMLAIQHELPMVVAGIHEGKNEINSRVEYFKLGINLKTDTPSPRQITNAINAILKDATYFQNVHRLSREFNHYNANEICAAAIDEKLNKKRPNPFVNLETTND